ncbi:MAG: thioredoxin family protein [Sphingomonadales bacterium]|nr:thioredoxin family protein [Sphingomonadales bacterium]
MQNLQNYWDAGVTWASYRKQIDDLLLEGKTTAADNSPAILEYAKLNQARMRRLETRTELDTEILASLKNLPDGLKILVIAEGWCGDAAQVCPPAELMFQALGLETRYVLRDTDTALIDMFLTNGGRSIPVFIALDADSNVIGEKWGPRPVALQELRMGWLKEGMPFEQQAELLHGWYAKDKTLSTQSELANWLNSLG